MGLTVSDLQSGLGRVAAELAANEARLNAADAKLGDGDTGTMLHRLFGTLEKVDLSTETELGKAFLTLAKAGSASTGSSLGTLVVGALMTAGKQTAGRIELDWMALGPLLAAVRDAAMARGKAEIGGKTIIDSLDYLARGLADVSDGPGAAQATKKASAEALADFRDRPSTVGRARMFAERSVGLDDPGMLAIDIICGAAMGNER